MQQDIVLCVPLDRWWATEEAGGHWTDAGSLKELHKQTKTSRNLQSKLYVGRKRESMTKDKCSGSCFGADDTEWSGQKKVNFAQVYCSKKLSSLAGDFGKREKWEGEMGGTAGICE